MSILINKRPMGRILARITYFQGLIRHKLTVKMKKKNWIYMHTPWNVFNALLGSGICNMTERENAWEALKLFWNWKGAGSFKTSDWWGIEKIWWHTPTATLYNNKYIYNVCLRQKRRDCFLFASLCSVQILK